MKYHRVTYKGPFALCANVEREVIFGPHFLQPGGILESWAKDDSGSRTEDNDLPRDKNKVRQFTTGDRMEGQARDDPMQHAQKGICQEPIRNGIRVNHAPTTRRQQFNAP